jgi:hypothetical protein
MMSTNAFTMADYERCLLGAYIMGADIGARVTPPGYGGAVCG